MRIKGSVAALNATILLAAPLAAGAAGAGLWTSAFQATGDATRCLPNDADLNNFCVIDDGGAVELGVKFTSTWPTLATGVRVYRIDDGPVTGSLWAADGTLLATGYFEQQVGRGWQDLVFAAPIPLVPGEKYIASYFAPNADYAYEWDFFSVSELTVGPITALKSVEGDRNGVFCSSNEPCFPTSSFRDLNYWVTPLWGYQFTGFFQPVDTAVWNKAKAGSAIPVKFSLGGNLGLDVLKAGFPAATPVACPDAGVPTDAVEETITAGASSLAYDPVSDRYIYTWKTSKTWAGKCYRFELGLQDGTSRAFDVQFVK